MTQPTRKVTPVRPINVEGYWLTDDRRYCEYARIQLAELEIVIEEVKRQWPIPLDQTLRNAGTDYPELWLLGRKRDLLSDSVKIFSAMAIEAFINYYGVVRLGEPNYVAHFERMGLIPKFRLLMLATDSLSISTSDPIVKILDKVAQRRNQLVHAKTREFEAPLSPDDRTRDEMPGRAREAVAEMDAFFTEFVALIPEAKNLVPPRHA